MPLFIIGGPHLQLNWILVSKELVFLQIPCVLVKDFELALVLEIFDQDINLLLDIEHRPFLLDLLEQFRAFEDSVLEEELLLLQKDVAELTLAPILVDQLQSKV